MNIDIDLVGKHVWEAWDHAKVTNQLLLTHICILLLIIIYRLYICLPFHKRRRCDSFQHSTNDSIKKDLHVETLIFFGSGNTNIFHSQWSSNDQLAVSTLGGHTTEMLRLIQNLDPKRYRNPHFVLCNVTSHSIYAVVISHPHYF